MERRIKSLARWNALAMVVQANRKSDGIGGHIASYASSATLYEVGFNHFFHGADNPGGADMVYLRANTTPGIYRVHFLEGRLPEEKLANFRRELEAGGGLSSYPHPWLMPDFWQFPTGLMGLRADHGCASITAALLAKYTRTSRPQGYVAAKSRGLPGRRRNRRTGIAQRA